MTLIASDFRYALRALCARPGLALLAILTLALGIGANVAIFSYVHGLLIAPPPYPEADRIVYVWNSYPGENLPKASTSIPDYYDRLEAMTTFETQALYTYANLNLAMDGAPQRLTIARATASLFELAGVAPALGRIFSADDDVPGQDAVIVLSDGLWRRAFGADPGVVGRDVRLNNRSYRVIGVMPAQFELPSARTEAWVPFAITPAQRVDDERGHEFSTMLARLAPNATVAQANAELAAIIERLKERLPQYRSQIEVVGFGAFVVPFREEWFGEIEPTLALLQGVVALVLLIACINVAGLLSTQLESRRRELALRAALGAGRGRLVRQVLLESLLLALAGAAVGILVALAGIEVLDSIGLVTNHAGVQIEINAVVLAFAVLAAIASGLLAGLLPAISVWRTDLMGLIREGGKTTGGPRSARSRAVLVVGEVALALTVLAGAGLMLRSFAALQAVDPGFEPQGVLSASVSLPQDPYADAARLLAFADAALTRVRHLPGVEAAGLITGLPFGTMSSQGSYVIEGRDAAVGTEGRHAELRVIDPGYFRTLGIPVLRGRPFAATDGPQAGRVAIIDTLLAHKYWPDGDPIGQRISTGLTGGADGERVWWTIVGIVGEVKAEDLAAPVTKETLYFPFTQIAQRDFSVVARTNGDPAALASGLRQAVLETDPAQPVYDVRTLEQLVEASLQGRRAPLVLLLLFGALAAGLAAIGLYGVLAFGVAQRSRELGTRYALGASPQRIRTMIVRQGIGITLLGVLIGVVIALAVGQMLSALLFGVRPADPVTLLAVAALLIVTALIASIVPAHRATRVDPAVTLREE